MKIVIFLILSIFNIQFLRSAKSVPRKVRIQGQNFVLSTTNETIVMKGSNVVVKGPPYMPSVEGDTACDDIVGWECAQAGNCKTCFTFNQADVENFKSQGWNTIRLGIVWAGAQPKDEDNLDAEFVRRLKAVLSLCDQNDIHVILDLHGDMVGSAGCGNGVPMWVQKKAAGELIGKPLETGFPYNLVQSLQISELTGYSYCGNNVTKWQEYAGDPNYNILNECCQQMNSNNPGALGFTTISQRTMDYILIDKQGRSEFVRYWTLIAEVVKDHPSAFAAELMNEPMHLNRWASYETWRAAAEAIHEIIPDMSVSLSEIGESSFIPDWLTKFHGAGILIKHETVEWIKNSDYLFYAWHYYGPPPKDINQAILNVKAIMKEWNVPSFISELGDCETWNAVDKANISHTYWHYSSYCNTDAYYFGNKKIPDETFGACILGWANGKSRFECN